MKRATHRCRDVPDPLHREILPVVERQDQPFALGNPVERSGDQVPLLPPITEFELVHWSFGRQMTTDRSSATASEVWIVAEPSITGFCTDGA